MAQIKTITATTTEQAITFDVQYQFVWLKNMGDTDCYVSGHSGITANADGVAILKAGENVRLTPEDDTVYIKAVSGTPTIEAHAQSYAECPFKVKAKGGESSITVEPILIRSNGEYTAPEGKAYSPVNVQTPVYNITPLTLTHNHQGADAGLYGGYSPVEVQIEMDTLNAPANGIYEIDENTQDGWDTVLVDVYEKYNELFRWNGWGTPGNSETLTKPISTTDYDEFWMVGHYAFNSDKAYNALWNTRFLTSIIFDAPSAFYGVQGSDNFLWSHVYANNVEQNDQYGYCYPCMYIGVKNKDREQELLWQNSSYGSAPSTIELSDSIFDYDEICLHFVEAGGSYHLTVWYPTSQLNINDIVYGYNDYDGSISKYTITANDTLSAISEAGYFLYEVYGIKDNSMQETVLFTNPSDSTMPATVTLSDAYTNYDEIVLVGHISGETTKGTQYYPVKALTGFDEMNLTQRIGIFTDVTNCWLSITSTTTLVPDATPGMIVDKIIGIKRPVVSTAHELIDVVPLTANSNGTYTAPTGTAYSPVTVTVEPELISRSDWNALTTAQKQAKGLVAIQDNATGYERGELVNGADYTE